MTLAENKNKIFIDNSATQQIIVFLLFPSRPGLIYYYHFFYTTVVTT